MDSLQTTAHTGSGQLAGRNIRRVIMIGQGDVVQHKLWPALTDLAAGLDAVAVCSLEPASRLNSLPHTYWPVTADGGLPLDMLRAHGFLAPDTLAVVATPSAWHVPYALQLAPYCRVAVEKPLAASLAEAQRLLPYASAVHPIDHKLFNAAPLALIETVRRDPAWLASVCRLEGVFDERGAFVPRRVQEDTLFDIQWHLLVILLAVCRAAGRSPEVILDEVQVAAHTPDPAGRYADARVPTASRLVGRLVMGRRAIPFDLRQAKGAPRDHKALCFYSVGDVPPVGIDLGESGCHAHGRLLVELLRAQPDMRHALADALAVQAIVAAAQSAARPVQPYDFGQLPAFTL